MIKVVLIDDANDAIDRLKESLGKWNQNENFDIIMCANFSNAMNSFRLFVIDFFDSYDNKCQKV